MRNVSLFGHRGFGCTCISTVTNLAGGSNLCRMSGFTCLTSSRTGVSAAPAILEVRSNRQGHACDEKHWLHDILHLQPRAHTVAHGVVLLHTSATCPTA